MEIMTQSSSTQAQGAVLAGANLAPERVKPCDFRTVGGIDKARLSPLVTASEAFARALTQSLDSRLGITCETTLQSSEQVPCRAFLEKASGAYLAPLQLGAQADFALLQIDSILLFPVVDRLLGGSGEPTTLSREVTEIEDNIARNFVRVICQNLEAAWRSFNVTVSQGARQPLGQLQRIFSAQDNGLVFSFSVNMQSAGGGFQLLLPGASLGAFLGTNSTSVREVLRSGAMNPKLAEKSLDWTFKIELTLLGGKVRASDLLNLSIGKILPLGVPVRNPVVLKIGGYNTFAAVPVRSGNHRGAQLLERLPHDQLETGSTQ